MLNYNVAVWFLLLKTLLLEAHEAEVKKVKAEEKLERRLAINRKDIATEVQPFSIPCARKRLFWVPVVGRVTLIPPGFGRVDGTWILAVYETS